MKNIPMLINGEWIYGDAEALLDVGNPSTGEIIAQISNASLAHVEEAVQSARRAFESDEWRQWKAFERGQLLIDFAHYIRQHAEEWSLLECRDVGKPLTQARADIEAAARYFEFYGGAADKVMGDTIPIEDGLLNAVVLEPVGITVHIVPWNYPIYLSVVPLVSVLAAGNRAIIRISESTSQTAALLSQLIAESILPPAMVKWS